MRQGIHKRYVGKFNRIGLPNELMSETGIIVGDTVEVWCNNDTIIIAKDNKLIDLLKFVDKIKSSIKTLPNIKNRLQLLDTAVELEALLYEESGGQF